MAKIQFKGLEEYELRISRLEKNADKIAGAAIYAGAAIVADEIKKGIDSLPVIHGYGSAADPLPGGVTSAQKQGLREGMGISSMQNQAGYLNVKIGFDGYNRTKTKEYPQGQPNQLVARGAESGASWKQKKPFIRPAVTRAKPRAEAKMAEVIDAEIEKLMK